MCGRGPSPSAVGEEEANNSARPVQLTKVLINLQFISD